MTVGRLECVWGIALCVLGVVAWRLLRSAVRGL
ncbi:hypothetical protein K353_02656 [Kitasatospora sp. SolWspMP-SS2h]|nr:hypothetical protein K353_02656 [Kitasatospora sp. SolWspMP-SS2h]